ncbi:hypothetical protein Poli38472_014683 [Pythium oligandrum]|uniref:Non-specific serine/threonine protein kinase n=1 Tax=Pythium oligandrum TaxID=41045 RepID=A0A8K1CJB4_PYTOL|nr:hypothetical protein Poli38472_014683 [Pythium oligandrum]|eukprot:TMW63978.1 hypothetical protein Poli38472_014683 [Pythium oligandrum]
MSATNNDGETPLYIPVTRGNIDMVEFLLKAGADVSAVDNNGFTPLHVAAKYYTTDIITALVDAGSDVHAKNTRGQTPLMVRIQSVAGVHISYILGSIYILTSRGATYDETYDDSLESHAIDSDESEPDEATAAFVLSCVRRWSDEQRRGKSPLTEVPSEIIDRGMTAVKTYLKEVSASTEQELIYRRKMCVVGSCKAGKTSLVKSITSMNATLVDVDDRTIGVDLFRLEFTEEAENSKMHHAITFWDFAGQDEYHVAHSLFFSRRTLYLLCVDAGELSHAVDKTHQARDRGDEDEAEMMVDTFVRERVWRWFRTIFIRQPDAEFVMIATKADMIVLDGESRLRDLESELFHVLSEYKGAFKREMQRDVDALLAECNDGDSAEDGMGRASNERISQLKHLQTQLDQSLPTS